MKNNFGKRSNYYFNLILTIIVTVSIFLSFPISISAAPTIPPYFYISTEVGGGNNATLRGQVDDQDDTWRADAVAVGATSFAMVDFGTQSSDGFADLRPDTPGPYPPGDPITNPLTIPDATYFAFPTTSGLTLEVTLLNMDGGSTFGGTPAGMTATYPRLTRSATLQDGAPRPASLYDSSSADRPRFWNEVMGSGANRNAILFQFSEPIAAFGAWFGDVETRTDGSGTAAQVQLFDQNDNIIDDQVIPTSTSDQSLCGSPVNDSYAGCGNETTRWVGFIDENVRVSAMLVIVGDDDSAGDTLGHGESLSFIGATVAEGISAPVPEPEPEEPELPATGFAPGRSTQRSNENRIEYVSNADISITIPSIDVNANVVGVPRNSNSWSVEWLADDVGYLQETSFPTWPGNTVLTGHVYDHFGLPGVFSDLNTLTYGDQILLQAWGQEYVYEIRETGLVDPGDMSAVEAINDGYDWLTLITCQGYEESSDMYNFRYIVRAVLLKVR